MSKGLLDPKVDFVFKNIFGSPNHPEILISFLNATLKAKKKIVVNVNIFLYKKWKIIMYNN